MLLMRQSFGSGILQIVLTNSKVTTSSIYVVGIYDVYVGCMRIYYTVSHNQIFVLRTDVYENDSQGADRAEEHLAQNFKMKDSYRIERRFAESGWQSNKVEN